MNLPRVHLVAKGASTVLVSNRTHAQAVALAQELNGLAIHFSRIWEGMKHADIVISSTGCPHFIITRDDMQRLMSEREGRPLFLIDIAVPRDIDPRVSRSAGMRTGQRGRIAAGRQRKPP